MRIYCDSSTKEACIVVEGQDPIIIPYPEPVTVNVGEYKAVTIALEEVFSMWSPLGPQLEEVEILTDSLLVAKQVNGVWKCRKEHLLPFREEVQLMLAALNFYGCKCELSWIPREENLAGKVLE